MHDGPAMPAMHAGVEPSLAAELELTAVPPDELVRRLYRLLLRREPEPDALRHAAEKLAEGTLARASLIRAEVPGVKRVKADVRSLPLERNS